MMSRREREHVPVLNTSESECVRIHFRVIAKIEINKLKYNK